MSVWESIKRITEDLKNLPTNRDFLYDFDYGPDCTVIQQPMNYEIISKKLSSNSYESPLDWYNDVCLIYKNAMAYHPPNTIYHLIAEYQIKQFQKLAKGASFKDNQSWFNCVSTIMKELKDQVARSPVPQGNDPIIDNIIKQAEKMPPPASQAIAELVKRLNEKINQETIHNDIITILKKTEPGLQITGEKFVIDADKLSHQSLNSLSLYINSLVLLYK